MKSWALACFGCGDDVILARTGASVGDVFPDAAAEKEHFLRDECKVLPQGVQGDLRGGLPIE